MKRINHVQSARDKLFRGLDTVVLHNVPARPQAHILTGTIPVATVVDQTDFAKSGPVGVYSAGRFLLCAVGLGAAILAATASSAGAYTSGSADYGTLLTQLQDIASQTKGLIGSAPTTANPTGSVFLGENTGSSVFYNVYGPEKRPYGEAMALALHGMSRGAASTTNIPGGVFDSSVDTYSLGTSGSVNHIIGVDGPGVFQWSPINSDPANAPSAYVNDFTTAQGSTAAAYWSVFNDRFMNSVFDSPNGNSYFDWLPYNVGQLAVGTTAANWKTADATANVPYSIFRSNTGGSVFQNMLGQGDFSASEDDTTGVLVRNSAFVTPSEQSVFMAQAYNLTTGGHVSSSADQEASQSVFVAGTGPDSGIGSSGTGSVFITDDAQNHNIGNSVFLDPYGNSYLDDITSALMLPNANGGDFAYGGAAPAPLLSYQPDGVIQLYNDNPNNTLIATNNQIGLAEELAVSLGAIPYFGSTDFTKFYAGYPYLSAEAQQIPGGMSVENWYGSEATTGWSNMFAQAFYEPPATGATILKPYLSEFSGWQNSSVSAADFTNAQSSLSSAINEQETYIMVPYVQANAPAYPGSSTLSSGLQGNFSSVWQLPVNALSTSFGYLTDSNTAEATANSDSGYAKDNTSINVVKSFAGIFNGIDPSEALEVPLTETTNTMNGGSTLTDAQMTAIPGSTYTETAATPLFLSGQTLEAQNVTDSTGTSPVVTNAIEAILMNPNQLAISAYMTGFVNGMEWFRGQFAWLAEILGWLLELFCAFKCWDLIQWGVNGGPFPLDISLRRPTPKHDSVSDPAGRTSPLNSADNYGRVNQEIAPYSTGTESMGTQAAHASLEAGAVRAAELVGETAAEAALL